MKLDIFIAQRFLSSQTKGSAALAIVRIALIGIVLGVVVMLLSVFITAGFKKEITDKLSGFFSDIEISGYGDTRTWEEGVVEIDSSLLSQINTTDGVELAYPYVTKPAILKKDKDIQGLVLRGVTDVYNKAFYEKHLVEGTIPNWSVDSSRYDVIISKEVAKVLRIEVGDRVELHFVQDPPRVRKVTIVGIYSTGFLEYDEMFALCSSYMLQRINGWQANDFSGIAVNLSKINLIPDVSKHLETTLPVDQNGNYYRITTLKEQAPQIFDWLALLNMNVWIILILVIAVAGFNMVSGLLILILDKTSMIGTMKALGANGSTLRRVFLFFAIGLVGRGVIIGNVIAISLGFLQNQFKIFRLDPTTYYMDRVPIAMDWYSIVALDFGVVIVATLMLIVPTFLIGRISPIEAIKFE